MNVPKIQQELLKALLANPQNVNFFEFDDFDDDKRIFITDSGVGYVLNADELRIDLSGAQTMTSLEDLFEKILIPENRLLETDEYRLGGTARKYLRQNSVNDSVYVDQKHLKLFNTPMLYQAADGDVKIIVVAESFMKDGKPSIVGCVLPVKVTEQI